MTAARALLLAHAGALVFGLAGMLVALPNPQLWTGSPLGVQAFQFGMQHAGALHIVLGAAAMLAFGAAALGWRRTLTFCVAACAISLGPELVGTGTGWPFGNYEYTDYLGAKVLGRVPFSIPLSWFYMGLASYLLAAALVSAVQRPGRRAAWSVALGAALMVVWDLVLDPAMVDPGLPVQFWVWQASPALTYYGMPLQNFAGWWITAALFMALSRLLWRGEPDPTSAGFPLVMYGLNILSGAVLSVAAGLWVPVALATVLGGAPAVVAWRTASRARPLVLAAP